jgi:hypothetical protein
VAFYELEVPMSESNNSDSLFDALLKRHESHTLDFKGDLPDFSSAESRDKFIKDVICLANTPRDEPAYIVFGVDHTPDTGPSPTGLPAQIDGVRVLDQLGDTVVQPRLTVCYIPVFMEGNHFGILEIPVVCSPKTGPGGMRVSEALRGQETNHEATHG